jgi:hypothetical protein
VNASNDIEQQQQQQVLPNERNHKENIGCLKAAEFASSFRPAYCKKI